MCRWFEYEDKHTPRPTSTPQPPPTQPALLPPPYTSASGSPSIALIAAGEFAMVGGLDQYRAFVAAYPEGLPADAAAKLVESAAKITAELAAIVQMAGQQLPPRPPTPPPPAPTAT